MSEFGRSVGRSIGEGLKRFLPMENPHVKAAQAKLGQAVRAYGARANTPQVTPKSTGIVQQVYGPMVATGNRVEKAAQEYSPRYKSIALDREIAKAQEQLERNKVVEGGEL